MTPQERQEIKAAKKAWKERQRQKKREKLGFMLNETYKYSATFSVNEKGELILK